MEGGKARATATTNHHSPPSRSPIESERRAKETNFGAVPCRIEVQNAISELRRMMDGVLKTISEFGQRMDQCPYDSSTTLMSSMGEKRLLDAYHLLQTDASVQRLVASISTDPEVWDAVMKNNAVRDFQGFLPQSAREEKANNNDQELDSITRVVKLIFKFMRSRIWELIGIIEVFVIEKLRCMLKKGNHTSPLNLLEEKVRSSLLLSVVLLLVIVVTRSMEGIIDLDATLFD